MTFSYLIPASGSFDISAGNKRVLDLIITNKGPGTIYWGDVPPPAIDVAITSAVNGNNYFDCVSDAEAGRCLQGMILTGGGTAWGTNPVVTRVDGKRVYVSDNAGSSDGPAVFTLTPPAISTANGHPLAPGDEIRFSAAGCGGWRNQIVRRLLADATMGGTTVTITSET